VAATSARTATAETRVTSRVMSPLDSLFFLSAGIVTIGAIAAYFLK
jgi:hypothetical protein